MAQSYAPSANVKTRAGTPDTKIPHAPTKTNGTSMRTWGSSACLIWRSFA